MSGYFDVTQCESVFSIMSEVQSFKGRCEIVYTYYSLSQGHKELWFISAGFELIFQFDV